MDGGIQKTILTQVVVGICSIPITAFFMFPYLTFFIAFAFLLIKSNPAVYVWENIKYMMFLDFKSEIWPENVVDFKVEQLPNQAGKSNSLKHSIYNDERIFKIIANWTQNQIFDINFLL